MNKINTKNALKKKNPRRTSGKMDEPKKRKEKEREREKEQINTRLVY